MNSATDQQLLREYAEHRSEDAFAELVGRHLDFVYSAALRMTGDPASAEDVAQGVFVVLMEKAGQLAERPVLAGWLHCASRNLAGKVIRSEIRRRAREQEAAAMNELLCHETAAPWENIAPHLDAAIGELSEPDRDAVILRYFDRKSAREMAQSLGISEEAAQKRVSRAVERLREFFAQRGVTVGASGLVCILSANAVQAAPAGLASAIATAGSGTMIAANTATTTIALIMTTQKKALFVAVISLLLFGGITAYLVTRGGRPDAKVMAELTGKWLAADGKETLEFLNDGTCQGLDKYRREHQGKVCFHR